MDGKDTLILIFTLLEKYFFPNPAVSYTFAFRTYRKSMNHNDWNLGSKSKKSQQKAAIEKAVLVGVATGMEKDSTIQEHLDELEFLAKTAGAQTVRRFTQRLKHPDTRSYIGKGKAEEIKDFIERHPEIELVLFDDELSAKQMGILEKMFERKIIDRTSLILDIFAGRAQTAQAKTQVELAQMQYLLPRLRGLWTHLERQRGGIGMRGPGEKEIETDRRIVRDKISKLKKKLEKIDRQSHTRRKSRGDFIKVALVGYTNAGKSTLMNLLTKAEVFAEDKLFATLDTTVRKVVWDATPFLLSDTVGFIRKLPHHLVESFKSTLDEVKEADILLHIVDVSHPQFENHMQTVRETLEELGTGEKPTIIVLNKSDLYEKESFDPYVDREIKEELKRDLIERIEQLFEHKALLLSAAKGENIEELRREMKLYIADMYQKKYPYRIKQW